MTERVPISGLTEEQVESIEEQVESSGATSRSEYLRDVIDVLDDSRLRAIDDDPLAAIDRLLNHVAPPTEAAEYDPAVGVNGTLSREIVYEILDYYDTPAIRPEDVEEQSLPGNVSPRVRALAAVARWQYRDNSPNKMKIAGKMAIKGAIRHPSSHVTDEYPDKVADELRQTGLDADNTMATLSDVQDWIERTEAVLSGLKTFADDEMKRSEEAMGWSEFEEKVIDDVEEGKRLLANVRDDEEMDRIAERVGNLEDALERARDKVSRQDISQNLENQEIGEPK